MDQVLAKNWEGFDHPLFFVDHEKVGSDFNTITEGQDAEGQGTQPTRWRDTGGFDVAILNCCPSMDCHNAHVRNPANTSRRSGV